MPATEDPIRAAGAEWLWLRDGSAVPAADALERLLDALEHLDGLPAPVLLASRVVGPDGAPVPAGDRAGPARAVPDLRHGFGAEDHRPGKRRGRP